MDYRECECGRMLIIGDVEKCHKCQSEEKHCKYFRQKKIGIVYAPWCDYFQKRILAMEGRWYCDECEEKEG